jgi:glycosyltransferase involved in cell wall biosynthesis
VLGKSGLKALQYMALEIPTVAQRIGTNLEIVDHGGNGFLADSSEEWLATLRRLVRDPDLRRRIGTAARRTVVDRYSVAVTAPLYLEVLRSVVDR